jgi:hypothetical protein
MYSSDQIKQIKQIISGYLDSSVLLDKIKSKVKDENIDVKDLDDRKLLEILKETDLFDKISSEMKSKMTSFKQPSDPVPTKLVQSKRALLIKLGQGKAFLNFVGGNSDKKLQFYVNFLKQRYSTNQVQANVEPVFNEVTLKFYFNHFSLSSSISQALIKRKSIFSPSQNSTSQSNLF